MLMTMEVGALIRELRERAGVTQAALAKALDVSGAQLSKIERGHTPLAAHHVDKIVTTLDLSNDVAGLLRSAATAPGVRLADLAAQLERIEAGQAEILRRLDGGS